MSSAAWHDSLRRIDSRKDPHAAGRQMVAVVQTNGHLGRQDHTANSQYAGLPRFGSCCSMRAVKRNRTARADSRPALSSALRHRTHGPGHPVRLAPRRSVRCRDSFAVVRSSAVGSLPGSYIFRFGAKCLKIIIQDRNQASCRLRYAFRKHDHTIFRKCLEQPRHSLMPSCWDGPGQTTGFITASYAGSLGESRRCDGASVRR